MFLSIIIPCFNEESTLSRIFNKVQDFNDLKKEIIIVDDGSNDNTKTVIEKNCKGLFSKFVSLEKNFGKGYALREGFKLVSGDIVIIQDADLEYDPEDYYKLVSPIINSNVKVVYGSRVIKGAKRTRPNSIDTFVRILANKFLTSLSNLLNSQNLTDAHTCYKVFKADILKEIELVENGFNFCPEITAKISKLGIKIMEVPISYYGRTHKEGKKISFIDGFRAIYAIVMYNIFYKKVKINKK